MVIWANGNKQFLDGAHVTIDALLAGDGQSAPPSHFGYDFDGDVVQLSTAFGLKMALQHLKQMQQINLGIPLWRYCCIAISSNRNSSMIRRLPKMWYRGGTSLTMQQKSVPICFHPRFQKAWFEDGKNVDCLCPESLKRGLKRRKLRALTKFQSRKLRTIVPMTHITLSTTSMCF